MWQMIRSGAAAVLAGCLLILAGCAPAAPGPQATTPAQPSAQQPAQSAQQQPAKDALQTLYEAAKAEGKVVYWGPVDPDEFAPLVAAFKQRFPGIAVEHAEIRSDDFVSRVVAESRQGGASFDVGEGRMASIAPLLERDLVQGHSDWVQAFQSMNLRPSVITESGRLLSWYNLLYVIAYNTKMVQPADLPTSWDDLLNPKWKGKLLLEKRANAFAYLGLSWGEDRLVKYLEQLKQQSPVYTSGGTGTAQQTMSGVAPISVGANVHKVMRFNSEGSPIDWAKIGPLGSTNTSVFVTKGGPHPNAGKLFAGYLAAEEAQKIHAQRDFNGVFYPGSPHPAQPDIEKHKIELVLENSANYNKVGEYSGLVVKVLGLKT